MHVVRHMGFSILLEHPTLWVDGGEQIVRDLIEVMTHPRLTAECLRHLVRSRKRLISGHYRLTDGRGCLMFVLTQPLGEWQIRDKSDLTEFFGRERGISGWPGHIAAKDSPEYQPAKWLVRLVDGQICEQVRARYGRACEFFDYDLVIGVAAQLLVQREPDQAPMKLRWQLAGR
jgi:hypothetical protein